MTETASGASHATPGAHGGSADRLGPFLCWAIVFADIGTSVYYVPGILYNQVGRLAGVFVTMTLVVFLLLTIKYAEATVRFPEGGGEVAVASRGLNPWFGALGGMFILIDYFLTASISSLSGLHYFQVIFPPIGPYVVGLTLAVIIALGILNWWGIQESATVSAVIATLAFLSSIVIIVLVLTHVSLSEIGAVFREIFSGTRLTGITILTGFAGAFLAFSGLESIAQLAPVMRVPRRKTVTAALTFVVITVGLTGPLLTIFSTVLLTDPRFRPTMARPAFSVDANPDQFISLLAGAYGGVILAVTTAIVASALLIFASNTAIIGAYHVVLALARMRYFPRVLERRNKLRGTPHVAIVIATLTPVVVLLLVQGNINLLGELYGFGLLGAFLLLCVSMDVIRWKERHGSPPIGATIDPELLRYGASPYTGVAADAPLAHVARTRDHRSYRTGADGGALVPATNQDTSEALVEGALARHQICSRLPHYRAGRRRLGHESFRQATGDDLRRRADRRWDGLGRGPLALPAGAASSRLSRYTSPRATLQLGDPDAAAGAQPRRRARRARQRRLTSTNLPLHCDALRSATAASL